MAPPEKKAKTAAPVPAHTEKKGGLLIDVHSHMYYPAYMDILRERENIPKVKKNAKGEDRLIILPNEAHADPTKDPKVGRPIGPSYFDVKEKLRFMEQHGITHSIISLANPWLDFLKTDAEKATAPELARKLNVDLDRLCKESAGSDGMPRLFGFGVLPTTAPGACAQAVEELAGCELLRGIILGTTGVASTGLDGPEMEPVYAALEKHGLVLFIHPHYGLKGEDMSRYGHSLELALGFPMETTIALSRLILSGVLDRFPKLKVYVAHAGGVLPYLQGRLDSCVSQESHIVLKKQPSEYLKDLYFDAIIYSEDCLEVLVKTVGTDRIFYGTDHPFFPPAVPGAEWKSAVKIQEIVPEHQRAAIYGDAAVKVFGLEKWIKKP